jgi:predicted RNA binding protein YcfA (HicA-like mRNA interferase family)
MTDIPWGALRSLTAREIISALIRDGFSLHNQRGSHQRYRHADGRRVTVTYHRPGDTVRPKYLPPARSGSRMGLELSKLNE